MDDMQTSAAMPLWQCHKRVWALKIAEVRDPNAGADHESDGSRVLVFVEANHYSPLRVHRDYVNKHKPQAGGYYVVYDDGYLSFSPAKAFEEGYTRL